MALADILAAIAAEGDRLVAVIAAEAEQEAAAILEQATAHAAALCQQELDQGAARARRDRARLLAQAHLLAAEQYRAAQEEAYQAVLAAARAALAGQRASPSYPRALEQLLDEALREIDTPPVIVVDPRDADLVRGFLEARGVVPQIEATLQTWGGIEARTLDGRIVVHNTLEARWASAEPFLRGLVYALWQETEADDGDRG